MIQSLCCFLEPCRSLHELESLARFSKQVVVEYNHVDSLPYNECWRLPRAVDFYPTVPLHETIDSNRTTAWLPTLCQRPVVASEQSMDT